MKIRNTCCSLTPDVIDSRKPIGRMLSDRESNTVKRGSFRE